MALKQEQVAQVRNWLDQHVADFRCTVCRTNDWQIGEIIAPSVIDERGHDNVGGQIAPMVQVICGNCARVELFAAIPIFS